jgi:signal peptidase I
MSQHLIGYITYRVASMSMAPTLEKGDYVLVQTAAYLFKRPAIGDVIVVRDPIDGSAMYMKRVVAIAGDRIAIRGGAIR